MAKQPICRDLVLAACFQSPTDLWLHKRVRASMQLHWGEQFCREAIHPGRHLLTWQGRQPKALTAQQTGQARPGFHGCKATQPIRGSLGVQRKSPAAGAEGLWEADLPYQGPQLFRPRAKLEFWKSSKKSLWACLARERCNKGGCCAELVELGSLVQNIGSWIRGSSRSWRGALDHRAAEASTGWRYGLTVSQSADEG